MNPLWGYRNLTRTIDSQEITKDDYTRGARPRLLCVPDIDREVDAARAAAVSARNGPGASPTTSPAL